DHSSIFRTLFSCLPPSNSVFNQMSTMSDASPFPMTLSPIARMFESLCSLVALAENVSCTKAHLRSEEHTSELQSRFDLICLILLPAVPTYTLFPYTTLFRSDHSSIFRTLFSCLPPSNSVFNQMSTMSDASPFPMTLSPIARMFESLCSLVALAENVSCTKAHL